VILLISIVVAVRGQREDSVLAVRVVQATRFTVELHARGVHDIDGEARALHFVESFSQEIMN
jgi:hypothetical protein